MAQELLWAEVGAAGAVVGSNARQCPHPVSSLPQLDKEPCRESGSKAAYGESVYSRPVPMPVGHLRGAP